MVIGWKTIYNTALIPDWDLSCLLLYNRLKKESINMAKHIIHAHSSAIVGGGGKTTNS